MNDFLSKLENFLFDILGLILPGAIFLMILLSPVLFLDMGKITEPIADKSVLLSALTTVSGFLKNYCIAYPRTALMIATISAYLVGHTVKVFSIIAYDISPAIFDRFINRGVSRVYTRVKRFVFGQQVPAWLVDLFKPFKKLLLDIFTFEPVYLMQRDIVFRQEAIAKLNTRLAMQLPDDQRIAAKLSSVITNQEGIRSLGTFFLAKYNLYRSLALIFLFTTFYYLVFFKVAGPVISVRSHTFSGIILATPAILWFTFHSKYKRYWTLYGDERIITLFYFLNKKKINEG